MIKEISSIQNPLIKEIILLREKSRIRRKRELFLIEGIKELELAIEGGYDIDKVLFVPEIINDSSVKNIFGSKKTPEFIAITNEIYKKIAYRETTEGIISMSKTKKHALDKIVLSNKTPLIIIAEGVEKPGNIGAILRTADAVDVDLVIIANPKTDIYNPNIIRSSVGCIFTNNIVVAENKDIIPWLHKNNINIYSATLSDKSKKYTDIDYKKPSAIVVGTEAVGLTKTWIEASTENIIIPMHGKIDSMNVSVSAGIILFEAKRQRE